jgi:hypothetical protein
MINQQDRTIGTIVGYRLQYGVWPTLLRCGRPQRHLAVHDVIATRIELVPSRDGRSWIAEGERGRQFKFPDDQLVPSPARARGLFEAWLGRPSCWLERWLAESLEQTELRPYTCKRVRELGAHTVGDVARRTNEDWAMSSDVSRTTLIEVATMLYDRGLAFGMTFDQRDEGVVVMDRGIEPDVLFHRLDFDTVRWDGAVVPSSAGERRTVLQGLAALSAEQASMAEAALAVRPVLPGAAALEWMLHSSLASAARESRMTTAQLLGYAADRVAAYHGMANGISSTWRKEVEGAVTWLGGYEARAGLHFHGISGTPCDSYAEVAKRAGMIDETWAFNAVEAFDVAVRRFNPTLPVTRATLRVLRKLGNGASYTQWWKALPLEIRPTACDELTAIGALVGWGWVRRLPAFSAATPERNLQPMLRAA